MSASVSLDKRNALVLLLNDVTNTFSTGVSYPVRLGATYQVRINNLLHL